jgi:hypothetical protein
MESRTSPGKKGSVQPMSGYLRASFCRSSLLYRPVALVVGGNPVALASRQR